jgi:NADH:ubiquinone oxidoreductase subunit E
MTTNDQSSGARPRWRPPTHHVRICLLESCEARDDELTSALERRLGIGLDERTADGIALEGLDCIGLCGIGEAVLIDGEPVIGQYAVLLAVDELLR